MKKLAKMLVVLCALFIIPISGPFLSPATATVVCSWGNCATVPQEGGPEDINSDSGWISRSDWTNAHLGSDTTKNVDSNMNHHMVQPLINLLVKVSISPDGTDNNSMEVLNTGKHPRGGYTLYQVNLGNIRIQTNDNGIPITADDGSVTFIDTEDWYYRIKVYRLDDSIMLP